MNVYLNSITGIDSAICAMYISKRHMTREKELEIRNRARQNSYVNISGEFTFPLGSVINGRDHARFISEFSKALDIGKEHITLLKFIDLNFSVYGLHRAGQDDIDSHAKRMDNRIIRESTRLAEFGEHEKSEFYKNKIITTDEALEILEMDLPDTITKDGQKYVKTVNGYIRGDLANNQDVKRGLYMESIPSSFMFSINLAEFAHMSNLRDASSSAHPEVQFCVELMKSKVQHATEDLVTPFYLWEVKN